MARWAGCVVMALICAVLSCVSSESSSRSTCTSTSDTIMYQVHSWNDLRSWKAGLVKGIQWLKIDPNYRNANFCATQKQVTNADPRGCFILNHNDPNETSVRDSYNTTDDVLRFIADPVNAQFFRNPNERIYIALCFKVSSFSACDNSTDNENWLSLITYFKDQADQIISGNGLNVEFILDGSVTVQAPPRRVAECTENLWTPWNMTYIYTDNPITAYTENDQSLGDYRFQILNTPVDGSESASLKLWDFLGFTHYGKFKDAIYPYLLWEPSDQPTIQEASEIYLKRGEMHSPGLRFAINVDPVQFQVYAADCSGTSWNVELNETDGADANATQPALVVFGSAGSEANALTAPFYALYIFVAANGTVFQQTVTYSDVLSSARTVSPVQPLSGATDAFSMYASFSSLIVGSSQYAIHVASDGAYNVYSFSTSSTLLSLSKSGTLAGSGTVLAASFAAVGGDIYGVVTRATSSCDAEMSLVQLSNDFADSKLVGSGSCAVLAASHIESASVSVVAAPRGFPQSVCGSELLGLAAVADSNKQVLLATLCVDTAGKFSPVRFASVVVGSSPSVSVAVQGDEVLGLLVVGEGFCWNTEAQNKDAAIGLCDVTPQPSNFSLTYSLGRLENIAARLSAGATFSSCDAEVLHGSFDGGFWPHAALYTTSIGAVGVVEIHAGVPAALIPPVAYEAFDCGAPLPSTHFLLDAWPVPEV